MLALTEVIGDPRRVGIQAVGKTSANDHQEVSQRRQRPEPTLRSAADGKPKDPETRQAEGQDEQVLSGKVRHADTIGNREDRAQHQRRPRRVVFLEVHVQARSARHLHAQVRVVADVVVDPRIFGVERVQHVECADGDKHEADDPDDGFVAFAPGQHVVILQYIDLERASAEPLAETIR